MNRWLTWFHRWAGVVLCLVVLMWFLSGAVLHFVAFPALSDAERFDRSARVDLSRLEVTPSEALAQIPGVTTLRLISLLGRPVYALMTDHGWIELGGDSLEPPPSIDRTTAQTIAEQFGRAPAAGLDGPMDYDQWIVHQHFDPYRPFYRVRLDDAAGTDLYVSARTGEVLQRTRRSERAWNWCGAVVHWIYFTPLRASYSAWNQTVWWLSLIALLTSSIGTWLGVVRWLGNRAAGRKGISPFRGWMRWHHVIGLFASVIVLFWIFSGWLSMDHGRLFSRGEPTPAQIAAVRGATIAAIAQAASVERLRAAGSVAVVDFNAILGKPFLSLRGGGQPARLYWLESGQTSPAVPAPLLAEGVAAAWPSALPEWHETPGIAKLYALAEYLPAEARAYVTSGASPTHIYIDDVTGRVLIVMDPSRIAYAWVFYALHTLKFPGLNTLPTLRRILVLALLAFGAVFSVTGVVLGVKRLQRVLA
jgi:uncharacterized iron-regulated membrane protein